MGDLGDSFVPGSQTDPRVKARAVNDLPANVDAERFVLGAILLDEIAFPEGALSVDDFSLERHRRIWRRMCDLRARGEHIDRLTVFNELQKRGEMDSLSYLCSLDDGLPRIPNLDSYIRILREKATRRRVMFACENLKARCTIQSEDLDGIIATGQELFAAAENTADRRYRSIDELPCIADCGSTEIEYLRDPELPRGSVVAYTGDSGCGKSTKATADARDLWRQKGIPSLFLDRENPIGVIADRLERLGMEDGPGIRFWGGWLYSEAPQPDDPIVRAWAKEHRGLIVVDSFSAFHGGDQNDASETRAFMHRCRRVADLGATVIVIHHDGKAETSKDYRGSSDFKAAIDQGFHISNFGPSGELDRLVLRPFKMRMGSAGEIAYQYAGGRFVRVDEAEVRETVSEELTALLRQNPAIGVKRFEDLAAEAGLGRNRARTFLADGVLSGGVVRKVGPKNVMRHFLAGTEGQGEF